MRRSGILLVLMLVMGMMLVACGEDDAVDEDGGNAQAAESTAAVSEPAATATTAPAATEAADDSAETPIEVEVSHAQGTTTVAFNPETVLVFDYSVLDTLDQLGIPVAGVPQGGSIPPFLSGYADSQYANIGTLFEPDYEKVNELDPDLIVVAGRSSAVYEDLAKMAPTIDLTIDQENFLDSYKERLTSLATIFGKEDEVAERVAEVDETVTRIQDKAAANGGKALIVMVSGGEVTAYGPGSRFGLIHDLLGVAAAEEDVEAATHGDAISFEFIQERNPDLLYVIDRDSAIGESGDAAAEVLDNELVRETNAWTNDAVTYLDSSTWYLANAGIGSFAEMLAEIEASLE